MSHFLMAAPPKRSIQKFPQAMSSTGPRGGAFLFKTVDTVSEIFELLAEDGNQINRQGFVSKPVRLPIQGSSKATTGLQGNHTSLFLEGNQLSNQSTSIIANGVLSQGLRSAWNTQVELRSDRDLLVDQGDKNCTTLGCINRQANRRPC